MKKLSLYHNLFALPTVLFTAGKELLGYPCMLLRQKNFLSGAPYLLRIEQLLCSGIALYSVGGMNFTQLYSNIEKINNGRHTPWHVIDLSARYYWLDVCFYFLWLHRTEYSPVKTKLLCPKYSFHKVYLVQNCENFDGKKRNINSNIRKRLFSQILIWCITSFYIIFMWINAKVQNRKMVSTIRQYWKIFTSPK